MWKGFGRNFFNGLCEMLNFSEEFNFVPIFSVTPRAGYFGFREFLKSRTAWGWKFKNLWNYLKKFPNHEMQYSNNNWE